MDKRVCRLISNPGRPLRLVECTLPNGIAYRPHLLDRFTNVLAAAQRNQAEIRVRITPLFYRSELPPELDEARINLSPRPIQLLSPPVAKGD
jgi:hypothetical protein